MVWLNFTKVTAIYARRTQTPVVISDSERDNKLSFLEEGCVSDIDKKPLQIGKKVASGSCGDM